ncbi:MAG TPA: serine hydrolase domain-containing protein [Candidatus Dormibacteraeota bacterium]|nr:serine hydrolase domain-containing protein [Candidatus Dormibacteraeota bacterium]
MPTASPPSALEAALHQADDLADRAFAGWHVPGAAYGVVLDGKLIHSRGLGTLRVGEEATPTASSVFRIASMTKSFTAATVLSLRDEGLVRLDDPIADYVPELAGMRLPTTDSPAITIRHLLTMTAGLPTDDPWGDRQQGLDLDEFRALLAGGLSFAFAPGVRFEYSNTGYGILGRLITNVGGGEYREVVRDRLLRPLGMDSTGYLESEVPEDRKAHGYVWRDGRYLDEPIDGYGALASMGGIFTTVEDLARWVAGFLDASPPRDGPNGPHPLTRATRREMQQPMVPAGFRVTQPSTDAGPDVEIMSYGFGLFMVDDPRFGRFVGHGGGYPGYGSGMRWHHPSGLGVIVLTNHRYGPGVPLARDLLNELLRAAATPIRRMAANAQAEAARLAIEGLIGHWDDQLAADLFAMNVDLDEPIALRRATLERIRERHGTLRRDDTEPVESQTPFHLAWWMKGDRGRVRIEILLTPQVPPRIQTFAVTSIAEPPAELQRAAALIVAALKAPDPGPITIDWPAGLKVGTSVDLGAVVRSMRATEARFAEVRLGPPISGDGETKATFRLVSARGRADLVLELDPDVRCLSAVSLIPARIGSADVE